MRTNWVLADVTIDGFDLFAFVVVGVLLITAVVVIVFLGGLPGKIATRLNHPYARAITAAGWISLVTLGALWPVAFVWAFLPSRSGQSSHDGGPSK